MKNKLIGITGQYNYDSLSCGTTDFMHVTDRSLQRLGSSKRNFHIRIQQKLFGYCLCQAHYASKLKIFPTDAMIVDIRSLRHFGDWLCHTRPDIKSAVNMSGQVPMKILGLRT